MKIAKTAEPVIDTTIVKAPRTVIPAKAGIQGRSLHGRRKKQKPWILDLDPRLQTSGTGVEDDREWSETPPYHALGHRQRTLPPLPLLTKGTIYQNPQSLLGSFRRIFFEPPFLLDFFLAGPLVDRLRLCDWLLEQDLFDHLLKPFWRGFHRQVPLIRHRFYDATAL